ncbi:helix-turn-helix domain-containing protein [Burkholderia ubonensis]|uniref:helix-turn-helix domain-containing protein n=1 Tax=Burkholderia ubonensis TaxID=101571 RepID=UPI00075F3E95|nr:helix-turn-helix domain-containing protein [Burkholderia ubonensis]KWC16346.1 hypothetical protein WL47_00260 [Burkholderia ubonensis]
MVTNERAALLVTREPEPEPDPRAIRLTIEQIARDAGASPRTVERCIAKAERAGWLVIGRVDGVEYDFTLTIPEEFQHG